MHATNTGCPTLFIFGSEECAVGGPQELPVCGAARRGLEAVGCPHVQIREIDGANHGYMGREGVLFETMFLGSGGFREPSAAQDKRCRWYRKGGSSPRPSRQRHIVV